MDDRGGGWVLFAGITLGLAGVLRIFDAIWAFNCPRRGQRTRRIWMKQSSAVIPKMQNHSATRSMGSVESGRVASSSVENVRT